MHPDPQTSIAGRYELERQLVNATNVALWRGHDNVLDRPIAVRIVSTNHPRAREVLEAARSTSRVDDRHVARVLDADTFDDGVYVVTAWAPGTDLSTLLQDGPLEADEALVLVGEIADTVAFAHTQGIPHLALDPTNVVVGAGDDVTLLGLAVDAVLWGTGENTLDPPLADARGLGALLYACLTARWPVSSESSHGLPAAPRIGPRLCTPRQVRAAVPAPVDVLCRRALGEESSGSAHETLDSPGDVADAIRALIDERTRGRWRPPHWFARGTRAAADR